jgi:hypothetical protein
MSDNNNNNNIKDMTASTESIQNVEVLLVLVEWELQ